MENTVKNGLVMVLKGAIITLLVTLIGVLVFAGVVKVASLNANVIKPVNQFIKTLAVFFGCFFSLKGSKGFIKGGLLGLVGTVVIYLVFALIGGNISFGASFLLDLLLGVIVGVVSGIITVNLKKS